MKKILLAASEAVPFIKTGGLADVVGSLPKYFDKKEYDVRIILPKYACMDESLLKGFRRCAESVVSLNWREQYVGVLTGKYNGISCYLLDNEYYFSGPAPYDHIYLDAEKFAYFSKAVLTVLPLIKFQPDVIHCNDWQTGLLPVFLQTQFREDPFYRYIKTVFTIHNMRYQGRWYMDAYRDITGLPDFCFTMETLECYGQANPLKGGLVYADAITTVSESYALEIQQQDGGEGLDGLLRARSGQLFGILNGLDDTVYDPETDPLIVQNFSQKDWQTKKKINKLALQEQMGLTVSESAFLIGMVSRMTDQKGFDLVMQKIKDIMEDADIQLILLGSGEERYESALMDIAGSYPGRMAVSLCYSEKIAHRIYASADAFLMPSMFEPCGLSQLMSLRYGTVPMVRETGGLKDTVEPYDPQRESGTGFTFASYDSDDMFAMIQRAHNVYKNEKVQWAGIVNRGMKKDYSWKVSAHKYAELYTALYQIKSAQIRQDRAVHAAQKKRIKQQQEIEENIVQRSIKKKVGVSTSEELLLDAGKTVSKKAEDNRMKTSKRDPKMEVSKKDRQLKKGK